MLNDRTYDIVKQLVQIVLPALGTLYFTLAAIWDLPAAEQVIGTLAAVATFLGVFLGLSHKKYMEDDKRFDGDVVVTKTDVGVLYTLELNDNPDELKDRKELSFKVVNVAA